LIDKSLVFDLMVYRNAEVELPMKLSIVSAGAASCR